MRLLIVCLLLVSCHPKPIPQAILRNEMPLRALGTVLQLGDGHMGGFGAPLIGQRILTVAHIAKMAPQAYWKGQNQLGSMELHQSFTGEGKDLAIYKTETLEVPLRPLRFSPVPPEVGEEVYWPTHTERFTIGYVRGWVVAIEDDELLLDGWFHPGTSGAPILRANGLIVGVAYEGTNWACQTRWVPFSMSTVADQITCLYRKSFFPAGALAARVDGWE